MGSGAHEKISVFYWNLRTKPYPRTYPFVSDMVKRDQIEIVPVGPTQLYFMALKDLEKESSSEARSFGDVCYDPSDPHFTATGMAYRPDFYFGDIMAALKYIKFEGKTPSASYMIREFKKAATKLKSVAALHVEERNSITNTFEDFLDRCGSEAEFLEFHQERLRRPGVQVHDEESAKLHILSKEFPASKLAYLPKSIQNFLSKGARLIYKDTGCSCMNKKKKKFPRGKMVAQNLTYLEVNDNKESTCSCMRKRKLKFSGCSCFKKNTRAVPESSRWKLFGTKFITTNIECAETINIPKDPASGISALDFVPVHSPVVMKVPGIVIIATLTAGVVALGFAGIGPFLAFIVGILSTCLTVFTGIILPIALFVLGIIFATGSGRAFANKVVDGTISLVKRVAGTLSKFFRKIWDTVTGIFSKEEFALVSSTTKDTEAVFTSSTVAVLSVLTILVLTEEFYNFSIEAKPEVVGLIEESARRIESLVRLAIAHLKNSGILKQLIGLNIGSNQQKTSQEKMSLWRDVLERFNLIEPAIAAAVSLYKKLDLGGAVFHEFIKALRGIRAQQLIEFSPTIVKLWISRSALTHEQLDGLLLRNFITKEDYMGKTAYDPNVKDAIQNDMSLTQLKIMPRDLLLGWVHSDVLNVRQVAYLLSEEVLEWSDLEYSSYTDLSDDINMQTVAPVPLTSEAPTNTIFEKVQEYHRETRSALNNYTNLNLGLK